MRRLVALLATLALCACSQGGAVEVVPPDELDQTIYGDVVPERATRVDLYYVDGNRLAKVTRTGRATRPLYEVAMIQLFRGPNSKEMNEERLTTAIPETTELLGVTLSEGTASVDMTEDFYRPIDDSPEAIQTVLLRLAQVVWTLTEIQGITRVQFMENGTPEPVLDQRRFAIDTPLARSSYRQFAPRGDRSRNVEQLTEL